MAEVEEVLATLEELMDKEGLRGYGRLKKSIGKGITLSLKTVGESRCLSSE